MPRGYRCIIVALVGFLAQPICANTHSGKPYAKAEQHQAAAKPPTAGAAPQHQPPAAAYGRGCDRAGTREDSDLCVQWGAVDAAREANKIASQNLIAAWFQAGGLGISLILSALAALAALRATKVADRSAELFRDVERAVLVPAPSIYGGNIFAIHYVNKGRSGATVVLSSATVHMQPPTEPINPFWAEARTRSQFIEPEKQFSGHSFPIPATGKIYVYGGIIYEDRFGRWHPALLSMAVSSQGYEIVHGADFSLWDDLAKKRSRD